MKHTKKLLALLLAVVMVCTTLPLALAEDGDATIYGTAGNLVWTLDNKGVLTINGEGAMPSFQEWTGSSLYYGSYAWGAYRGSITKVIIKDGVTNISQFAFRDCASMKSITIPNSVESIGVYAFYNCNALTSVTIPDSVTDIYHHAFDNCTAMTSVTLPNGIKTIEGATFYKCRSLQEIIIPGSVTGIGNSAFNNCDAVTSITIPDSVTNIGDNAFSSMDSLVAVTIGSGVTNIGSGAFSSSKINYVDIFDLVTWCKISFSNAYSNPLHYGKSLYLNGELLETIDVPQGISAINAYAFYNCKSIKNVTLPITVGSIGPDAFSGCSNLESVTILNGLCTIVDSETAISPTATIIGYDNTEAQAYAEKYGRTFVSLGEYTHEHTPAVHEVPGTCQTKGYRLTTCSVCGEQLNYENLGYGAHQYTWMALNDATCIMDGHRKGVCQICESEIIEQIPDSAMGHTASDWIYSEGFDCEIGGTRYKRCAVCNVLLISETVESRAHRPVIDPEVPKTCTMDGKTAGQHCDVCGKILTPQIIFPAEGHKADANGFTVTKAATCTEAGEQTAICGVCGESFSRITPATGHCYESTVFAPTCVNDGFTRYVCTACGDTKETDFIYAKGHQLVDIPSVPATCLEDGKTTGKICTNCGEIIVPQEIVPKTGHSLIRIERLEPKCLESGHFEHWKCNYCGQLFADDEGNDEIDQVSIPALGHTFTDWNKFVMATDATVGVEIRFCSVCGYYELRQAGPTNPTDPTTPTNPTDPTNPTNPTDPTEPTNPTDPTEPTNPTDPTDPTNPTDPTEPTTEPTTQPSGENEQNEEPQGFFQRIAAFFRNLFDRIFGIFRR